MGSITATGLVLLALVPWVVGFRLSSYTSALALAPALLSLGLLVYVAGSFPCTRPATCGT